MESDLRNFVLKVILAALGSILIGFVFLGNAVFKITSPAFEFVAFGIFAGLMLATSRFSSIAKSFVALALLTFLYEIILPPFGTTLVVRDVFFLLGIGLTVLLFRSLFFKRLEGISVARPLVLGALFALNGILITTILSFVIPFFFDPDRMPPGATFQNMGLQFLIGLGLGIGDEISELTKLQWKRILRVSS